MDGEILLKKVQVIIHIGTEKTGSTSLQKMLKSNRDHWKKQGYLFSESMGRMAHLQLVAYSIDDNRDYQLFRVQHEYAPSSARATFRTKVRDRLRDELTSSGRDLKGLLFSSEHFHSRIAMISEIERLRLLLTTLCAEMGWEPVFEIVVYLRRQSDLLESKYFQYLISGGTHSFGRFSEECHIDNDYYNYQVLVSRWMEVFGKESMRIRKYSSDDLIGGDVRHDFLDSVRWPVEGVVFDESLHNRSLSAMGLRTLRFVNRIIPGRLADGRRNPDSQKAYEWIRSVCGEGRPVLLKPQRRTRIDLEFKKSNQAIGLEF